MEGPCFLPNSFNLAQETVWLKPYWCSGNRKGSIPETCIRLAFFQTAAPSIRLFLLLLVVLHLQGVDLGLTVAVLADSGGGAPLLVASRYEPALAVAAAGKLAQQQQQQHVGKQQPQQQQQELQGLGEQGGIAAAAAEEAGHCSLGPVTAASAASAELVAMDSGTLAVEASPLAAGLAQLSGGQRGLVLLVPLVLGLGKVSPPLPSAHCLCA